MAGFSSHCCVLIFFPLLEISHFEQIHYCLHVNRTLNDATCKWKAGFFHCALTFRCLTTKSTHLITSLRRHFPFIHCQLNHKLLWFSHTCDFTGESNTVTSSDFSLSYPDIKFKFPHRRRICVWNLQEFDFSFKLLIWRFIDSKHTALKIISLRQFRQMKHFHYE